VPSSLDLPVTHPGWRFFTDQVMGGVSSGEARVETVAGRPALRLRGTVSLDYGGGFIQVVCPLGTPSNPEFDASALAGIELEVQAASGPPGGYAVHLRTTDTRAPWQLYAAILPLEPSDAAGSPSPEDWRTVFLPWAAFRPKALRLPLDPGKLRRVGIVAAGAAFEADLAVARLTLVGDAPGPGPGGNR
jgi:hypothetical protein